MQLHKKHLYIVYQFLSVICASSSAWIERLPVLSFKMAAKASYVNEEYFASASIGRVRVS